MWSYCSPFRFISATRPPQAAPDNHEPAFSMLLACIEISRSPVGLVNCHPISALSYLVRIPNLLAPGWAAGAAVYHSVVAIAGKVVDFDRLGHAHLVVITSVLTGRCLAESAKITYADHGKLRAQGCVLLHLQLIYNLK